MRPVLRAFSIVYWAYCIAIMPPLMVIGVAIWLVTLPFDRRRVVLHLFSCLWASLYVWPNPLWRVRIEGREKVPWQGAAVLVANHLSLLDILVVYGLFRPFKWVAKAELFKVPIVGWVMWINDYVKVLRGDRESIKHMMDHCRRHLAAGTPVLIFPEGTRSRDGRLQRFKDGAFRLAVEARCPVIPIAITGTYDSLPKSGAVLRNRADCRVKVLDPVDPAGFDSSDALREAVRARIEAELPEPLRGAAVRASAAAHADPA